PGARPARPCPGPARARPRRGREACSCPRRSAPRAPPARRAARRDPRARDGSPPISGAPPARAAARAPPGSALPQQAEARGDLLDRPVVRVLRPHEPVRLEQAEQLRATLTLVEGEKPVHDARGRPFA